MKTKVRVLLGILSVMVVIVTSWYLSAQRVNQGISLLSVSTDKQQYYVNDTVRISIHNGGEHAIYIFCPSVCALGNFPTTVERSSDGQWQEFVVFCPSIEPLFESGAHEGEYIRHTLSAGASFQLELANFHALRLEQDERLRIVYHVGAAKTPIYSNEFVVSR